MKKLLYFALAVSAGLFAASCGKNSSGPEMTGYDVIVVNYSSLIKGETQGEDIVTVPVKATSEDGTLDLDFYSKIHFLAPGAYTVGEGVTNFTGHFKNSSLDADINNGMIKVTLNGTDHFDISGTVRLKDKEGTIVKIRAKGVLEYEIPTNYYYTEENGKFGYIDNPFHIYKVFDKASSVQVAQIMVMGEGEGDYVISPKGDPNTAAYGTPKSGCWFYDPSYGTYIMIHGGVTVGSTFPERLDFYFNDKFNFTDKPSVDFVYCEKKQDLVPAVPVSSGDVSFMMARFYSIPSPVMEGKYELTVKVNYTMGDEFLSFTGITDTPNPLLEPLNKDGDSTGGVAFMSVSYKDYLEGKAEAKNAIEPTCFYVWQGQKYEIPFVDGYAMVANVQMKSGIIAGLLAPTNMAYELPEPLNSGLAAQEAGIWNLMFYYF